MLKAIIPVRSLYIQKRKKSNRKVKWVSFIKESILIMVNMYVYDIKHVCI